MKIARTQLKIHNLIDVRKSTTCQICTMLSIVQGSLTNLNKNQSLYNVYSWIFSLYTQLVGGFNPFENISQSGNPPQIGVKIKNIWVATTQLSFVHSKNESYFHLISPFTFLLANKNHQHFHHFQGRLCHCCERSHAVIPKPSSCASASIITSLKIITAWLKSKLLSRSMVQGEWIWRMAIFGDCHAWEVISFQ